MAIMVQAEEQLGLGLRLRVSGKFLCQGLGHDACCLDLVFQRGVAREQSTETLEGGDCNPGSGSQEGHPDLYCFQKVFL